MGIRYFFPVSIACLSLFRLKDAIYITNLINYSVFSLGLHLALEGSHNSEDRLDELVGLVLR